MSLCKGATVLAFFVIFAVAFQAKAQDCPENEYFAACRQCRYGVLEWSCKTKYPSQATSVYTYNKECLELSYCAPTGCYCYSNFARNDAGKCIPNEQCENYKPGPTEES